MSTPNDDYIAGALADALAALASKLHYEGDDALADRFDAAADALRTSGEPT